MLAVVQTCHDIKECQSASCSCIVWSKYLGMGVTHKAAAQAEQSVGQGEEQTSSIPLHAGSHMAPTQASQHQPGGIHNRAACITA